MTDDEAIRLETLALMRQYQTLLTEARFGEWIELWADDGVCEFPFASPGRPKLLQGKEQILAYMTAYPSRISIDGVHELRVHPALDPNVVIVEMTIKGRAVETDKPYNQHYVIVAETRDGKLTHYREYWNPLVSAEALS
jgi:ketosteroid isomerase-like protein